MEELAATVGAQGESSGGGEGGGGGGGGDGKYVRYTAEQVEALERVYAECPKPSSTRRQQLIRECPILSNIESKQIKVWFQNRRLGGLGWEWWISCAIFLKFVVCCDSLAREQRLPHSGFFMFLELHGDFQWCCCRYLLSSLNF